MHYRHGGEFSNFVEVLRQSVVVMREARLMKDVVKTKHIYRLSRTLQFIIPVVNGHVGSILQYGILWDLYYDSI